MGILINDSQIGGETTSNSFHNIGDIFYTMRTDTILNGAVECDGSQYNFTDFPDIKNLLENNQLPYITINEFDSQVESTGICGKFGYKTKTMLGLYLLRTSSENILYIGLSEEQYNSFYDTMNNCKTNDILPYKLYDLHTCNLLEGYYLKCTDDTIGQFYVFNNENEQIGSIRTGEYEILYDEMEVPDPDNSLNLITYFKVPKLSNIFIESGTNTNIGNYVKAGLPNITATLPADDYNTYGWAGAFYEGSTVNPATRHLESMSGQYHPVYFDASRCSSIYGNSTTVQPPAVLYRTMIQLKN